MMRIKTMVVTVLSVVMMMFSAVCFAQITEEDLNIGGIYPGQPLEEVVVKFGQPRIVQRPPIGYNFYFKIGDGDVLIQLTTNNKDGIIRVVNVLKNTGMTLPTGIGVGATEEDIIKVYGEPDDANEYRGRKVLEYRTSEDVNGYLFFTLKDGVVNDFSVTKR